MEVYEEKKKRVRDDSGNSPADMPETKLVRFDSSDFEQIVADAGDFTFEYQKVKAIQDDLLNIIDDSDSVNSPIQGLDSVIRSLEEEIHLPPDSGGSLPELGYLLGASDDELGIPPTIFRARESEDEVFNLQASGSSAPAHSDEFPACSDEIPGQDSFDIGIGADFDRLSNNDDDIINLDFIALDGLFDHSNIASEFPVRFESLSA